MDLHTLALVCRTWEPAARQAAYAVVSLRKKEQMDKLYSTIEQSSNDGDASEKGKGQGGRRIAAWIREIDVKVSTATRSMRRLRGGNAPISTTTGPFAWMHTGGGGHPFYSSSTVPLASSDTCGTSLGRLLSACPNVASVEVSISNGGSSYGYSIGAEFLEAGLLESLCTMRGLRSVTWRQSLDFGDLVEILREVKTIENLSLPAGVTNLSSPPPAPSVTAIPAPGVGIGAAVSSVPEEPEHQARLKSFQCSNWDFPSITPAQLCWILRPAVHTIKTLDLGSWSGNGAFGLNGAPQGGGRSPPWATAEVADLLVQMKAVERVALRDLHGLGVILNQMMAQVDQSLRNDPHNGYLDHSLSHFSNLTELAIDWSYTGPEFLTSLAPSIESLLLFGAPTSTNADPKDLLALVERKNSKLTTLVLSGWPVGVAGSWNSKEIRALRSVCHRKGCLFAFTGGS
ncbi:hypothetical protein BT69DRAFT_1357086 [Atractiella rhizophila]|nr:hypothetical protein BT69DRAFT_1357086 [Atractiella rhizophila]